MARAVLPSQKKARSEFLDLEKFSTGVGSCDASLSELTACAQSQVCHSICMVCKKGVQLGWDGMGWDEMKI